MLPDATAPSGQFSYAVEDDGERAILQVHGSPNYGMVEDFLEDWQKIARTIADERGLRLVGIDLSYCQNLASTMLGGFFHLHEVTDEFRLVCKSRRSLESLAITGIDQVMEIHPSCRAAFEDG